MKDETNTSEGSAAGPCSADLILESWQKYHGPISDEAGEDYIPTMPPAFIRGFVDGYEAGKCCRQIVDILILVEPIMEAWAKSHELHEWHCRVEDLIGTKYPSFMDLPNTAAQDSASKSKNSAVSG